MFAAVSAARKKAKRRYEKRQEPLPRWALNLKRLRQERQPKITQDEVKARAGVDHYGAIESGIRRPREDTLGKLARALSELLGRVVTSGEIMGDPRADDAVRLYEDTLTTFLQNNADVSDSEREELRRSAEFPGGIPTVETWGVNLQIIRLRARLHQSR